MCLSTSKFEDLISELLNRIFQMIDTLSVDISDVVISTNASKKEYHHIGLELTSVISAICQQCSTKIFQVNFENKQRFFLTVDFLYLDDSREDYKFSCDVFVFGKG